MRYLLAFLVLCTTALGADWEFEFVESTPQRTSEAMTFHVVMFTAEWCTYCKVADREDIPVLLSKGIYTHKIDTDKKPEWKTKRNIRFKSGVTENQISSLPTFWLIQRDALGVESVVKEWKGRVGATTILKEIPTSDQSDPDVVVGLSTPNPVVAIKTNYQVFSIYNGQPNNSHKDRQSLINHLMYGSVHKGKHKLSDLMRMSDIDLDSLHNFDHP